MQWVSRPDPQNRRRYTGRISAGTLSVGDEVVVLPSGSKSTVISLDTLDDNRSTAVAPLSVSVELADDIDVGRGDVLVSGGAQAHLPVLARELEATICWLSNTPLRAGDRIALKHTSRTVRATVQELHTRLDPETLDEQDSPVELGLNDIGTVTLRTSSVVVADTYDHNRDSGAFILIDEQSNDTVGAGTILEPRVVVPGEQTRNDIKWHPSSLERQRRWASTTQRGATIWLTGLPASGKSTVAVAVERALVDAGRTAYLLDGDNVRHGISDDLGFSPGDRAENIRRVGHLTRLFADAGVVAIASMVSPLRSDRAIARALNEAAGLTFLEVAVTTPVEECERRDPKGLYARARAGELKGLTGIDAPYETPEDPDLAFDTTGADINELVRAGHRIVGGARSRKALGVFGVRLEVTAVRTVGGPHVGSDTDLLEVRRHAVHRHRASQCLVRETIIGFGAPRVKLRGQFRLYCRDFRSIDQIDLLVRVGTKVVQLPGCAYRQMLGAERFSGKTVLDVER